MWAAGKMGCTTSEVGDLVAEAGRRE